MDLAFTQDQQALRQLLQMCLPGEDDARRTGQWNAAAWASFADAGEILRVGLPTRIGGAGGPVEIMIVMEALGSMLLADAYLETIVMGGGLLSHSPDARFDDLLLQVAAGNALIAIALYDPNQGDQENSRPTATRCSAGWRLDGRSPLVVGASLAGHWIVEATTANSGDGSDAPMLFLIERDAPGVKRTDYPTIDGRCASDLQFHAVSVSEEQLVVAPEGSRSLLDSIFDAAVAAHCAEAVGVMRRMFADTVSHCKQRRQFGRPLSSFQALQHRMVDMNLQISMAASATLRAALSLERSPAERARATSAAKATVATACRFVGQNAIQLHGGLGMRDDTPVTRFFRRATAMESELGGVDWHVERFRKSEAKASESENCLG